MNELIVSVGDQTNKQLLSILVIVSAAVIVIALLLFLKRKNTGK